MTTLSIARLDDIAQGGNCTLDEHKELLALAREAIEARREASAATNKRLTQSVGAVREAVSAFDLAVEESKNKHHARTETLIATLDDLHDVIRGEEYPRSATQQQLRRERDDLREGLNQAAMDIMNLSALLRLEGKSSLADIGDRMERQAREFLTASLPPRKQDTRPNPLTRDHVRTERRTGCIKCDAPWSGR